MGCFSCFSPSTKQDDPSEDQYKTAIKISKHEKEDRIVRRKREKDKQVELERAKEESLKIFEQEEAKRRQQESKEEVKRDDEQIEIDRATEESLKLFEKEEEKRRLEKSTDDGKRDQVDQVDDEQIEIDRATEESLKLSKKEEEKRRLQESIKEEGQRKQEEDDDQVEEEDKGLIKHSIDKEVTPPSICNGCKTEIKEGLPVNAFGGLWHPQCLCCLHCHKPIALDEALKITIKGKFHKTCYKEHRFTCCVCQKKIPLTEEGRKYKEHPFWKEKYCPCHESDGTAKCCSCERLEPRGTNFVLLSDDRWLCPQCVEFSVMDTYDCHDLHLEIRDFFEGLFLKVEKEFPLLLVEKQALNKAEQEEKIDYQHAGVTRGLCLSEVQKVTSVKERPEKGPNNTLINMVTETQMVSSGCSVTAILILYGLPRFLTGCILAHEMMHAWLRLTGYENLKSELEEGLCQVLGHMWLESKTFSSTDEATASSSSSRAPPAATTSSKKGDDWTEFEKKLVEFCKHQIETDESLVYGEGFRKVNHMVTNSNLQETIKEIRRMC